MGSSGNMASEILVALGGSAGMGAVWAIQHFITSRNGNGKLSKDAHDALCGAVHERLDAVDKQFKDIMEKTDLLFELLRGVTTKIDTIDGYICRKKKIK
jgi:hypothetical protein